MAIKKTSKEDIVAQAIRLFKLGGYYSTSMANIADACGLIKGSIYHYFKSKEEIGLEALKRIHDYFDREIYRIAYRGDLSDGEKLRRFVEKVDDYFLHSEGGCLLGNFALEISTDNALFRDEIRAYFSDWEKALAHMLEGRYGAEKAAELSSEYVALTQGEIMMMNLFGSPERYLKVGEKIRALLA